MVLTLLSKSDDDADEGTYAAIVFSVLSFLAMLRTYVLLTASFGKCTTQALETTLSRSVRVEGS